MVMVRATLEEPENAITCAGRVVASRVDEDRLRRQLMAGNPGTISDVRFCSTSMLGTADLSFWVYFTRNGIPSGLYTVEVAQELGIVTPEAVQTFMGGPRRTAEELAGQRAQTAADNARADAQADEFQGIGNLFSDLLDSGKTFAQRSGSLITLVLIGYVGLVILKAIDD
tara:strand:+ start:336 stop:845 length:510 start_codon:yes stop_codon:yes gene_type:complete